MPQFFNIIMRGDLTGQQTINSFWYVRLMNEPPTAADVSELVGDFFNTTWPAWAAVVSNTFRLKQLTGYGYSPTWARTPYLPYVADYDTAANVNVGSAPPVVAAVLGCRVEPIVPGPHGNPTDGYVNKPVRKGYWAMAGLPSTAYTENGRITLAFRQQATVIALQNNLKAGIALGQGQELAVPCKVSELAKGRVDRGYGLIDSVRVREELSTRRSRKVGVGA